jgi:TolB-like protein
MPPIRRTLLSLTVALTAVVAGPWCPGPLLAAPAGPAAAVTGPMTVAVVDFRALGVPGEFGEAVAENFRNALAHLKRFTIVERGQIQQALKEQAFGQSGLVDAKQAQTLGRLLGARIIVVGSVTKIGQTYTVNARFIDVVSGETKEAESLKTRDEDQITGLIDQLAATLSATAAGSPAATPVPTATRAPVLPKAAAVPALPPPGPDDWIAKRSSILPAVQGAVSPTERVVSGAYPVRFRNEDPLVPPHEAAVYVLSTGQALYIGIQSRLPVDSGAAAMLTVDGNGNRLADGQAGDHPIDFLVGLAAPGGTPAANVFGVCQGASLTCQTADCADPLPSGLQRSAGTAEGQAVYEFLLPMSLMRAAPGTNVRLGLQLSASSKSDGRMAFPARAVGAPLPEIYRSAMVTVRLE